MQEVQFLGHVLLAQGIAVDPAKLKVVIEIRSFIGPKSMIEIRSFIGLAGYYRRFVKGFSKIVAPLTQLTKKEQTFAWTNKCDESLFSSIPLAFVYPLDS